MVRTSNEIILDSLEPNRRDISYDTSLYDGGYYVWGDYYVMYKIGDTGDIYSLFFGDSLIVADVTQMSYIMDDDFFVCMYMSSEQEGVWISVIYGKDGSELFRAENGNSIIAVSNNMNYIMESTRDSNQILIEGLSNKVLFEWIYE